MSLYASSDEDNQYQPITWWNGHGIYAAHLIVIVYVVSMLVTTVLEFARVTGPLSLLTFDSSAVLHLQVWRIFTYGLVNPPGIWFAVDMVMMVMFGREVEKFFGRAKFLFLFAVLYLITPLLFTALGVWWPTTLEGETGSFAMFIAFAALYPDALLLFNLLAKWVAVVLVGMEVLSDLATHNWPGLISLAATCGFAWAYVRHARGYLSLPTFRLPRRQPKLRVLPDLPKSSSASASTVSSTGTGPYKAPAPDASMAEIDALLDKIAKSGLNSLTAKERAKLEQGRKNLQKKRA